MPIEYVLFNLIVLSGPLALSFDRKVRYFRRWPKALIANILVMIPFVIWDVLVTGKHWWFNEKHTLGLFFLGLPLGEYLFFSSVPFASLFIWDVLLYYWADMESVSRKSVHYALMSFILIGLWFFYLGKYYTGLTCISFGSLGIWDRWLKTNVLSRLNAVRYLAILTILMFIFNGYLTARPVILYDRQYQLNLLIYTIPIEDFFYGYALLLANTIIYEKLKGRHG